MNLFRLNKTFRRILFVVISLITTVSFNNCSGDGDFTVMNFQSSSRISSPVPADEIILGKALYATNCAACHGPIDSSTKLSRTASVITSAIASIAQMKSRSNLTAIEIGYIAKALAPAVTTSDPYFTCDPKLVSKTPLLKLTNREFKTELFALVNDFSTGLSSDTQLNTLAANIPSDSTKINRFAFKEENFLLSSLMTNGYFDVAYRAGELVANSTQLANYPNTNSCLGSATITQACHQLFVMELGSRTFRKTLSTTNANSLAATLWDSTLSKTQLIQLTFTSLVQMPEFMYQTYDQGSASAKGVRVVNLNAEELAAKLSLFLIGKSPDATLKSLASSGQILNNTILAQQVDRLLLTPEAQETVKRLFRESYGYERFDDFNYSAAFLNGLSTTNLASAMTQELDNFFIDTVLNNKGTFNDLMTSKSSNISSTQLSALYGVSGTGAITLPANRSGFLNRAAFLAKKSGNYTSPVKRGLAVLENILCGVVGDPPPNAPTAVPETQVVSQYQSTRDRYANLSEIQGTSCIACHSRINSIGYTFEEFDSIGRARSVERVFDSVSGPVVATVNINTQTTIPDLRTTPTLIQNSTDLSSDLGKNNKAMMCFTKNIKKFQSRVNTINSSDNCQLNGSLQALYGTNGTQGSIQDAIKNLILSDDFKLWSY